MKTIWLIWGCGLFCIIYLIASAIYLILVNKFDGKSTQVKVWIKHENKFSPIGLDKFQLTTWRITLISRWIGGGLGALFIIIEILIMLFMG
ncbi:hypothetical protein [Propionivibrio sp.]|uniref:hypothetical protein n=1 Tax=Propionivibrio sp. TaxID=2212460 RepID=UPI0039E2A6C5